MGTLPQSTRDALLYLRNRPGVHVGVVGGSDRPKAVKQLGLDVLDFIMDHCFHENGCVYYRGGDLVAQDRIEDFLSQRELNEFVSFILRLIADSDSPWKTGTFIERRSCMLNISPIGRACTQQQREQFFAWDKQSGCRSAMVQKIRQEFPDLPFELAVGGQISIDVYPTGFNKTRCLKYVNSYDKIYFIGDSVQPGGNDYELYVDPGVTGIHTSGFQQTEQILYDIASGLL
jgi:phosphomannomutase